MLAAGFSAALKVGGTSNDILRAHPVLGPAIVWAQTDALDWLIWLVLIAGVTPVIRKYLGPPWVWNLIETQLAAFREQVFRDVAQNSEAHHHRVTLFKYVRLNFAWPPWWGWLIPVARSSHTTRRGIATFRAPDNPYKAEGVAGRVWAKEGALVVSGLPNITAESPEPDLETYAKATSVSVAWIKQRLDRKSDRPLARSYGGYPVQVGGKPWGVVILDSQSPDGITNAKYEESRESANMLARFLGQLLERAR